MHSPHPSTKPNSATQSWWKILLDFLWDGGYRSTIVFFVTLGAIGITVFSDRICRPMPASLPQPESNTSQSKPVAPTAGGAQANNMRPSRSEEANQIQQPVAVQLVPGQPNPICAKYFELAFMVVGGYLGLSMPKSDRTQSDSEPSGNNSPSHGNQNREKENRGMSPQPNVTPAINSGPELTEPELTELEQTASRTGMTGQSSEPAVIEDGQARLQATNPDAQQTNQQQASSTLSESSRGVGLL